MSEAALLTLSQWLSPAFPVGGFAYSQGLEWAIASGMTGDGAALERWLADLVEAGSVRNDAILLALALRPDADHPALAVLAEALAPTRERQIEAAEQGRAFTEATNGLTGAGHAPASLPVAVGRAAAPLGLDPARVVALYLQAQIANLVQAAVRFMPMGQAEGQRILAALQPRVLDAAAFAAGAGLDDLGSATFGADLACALHEGMETRIFRS